MKWSRAVIDEVCALSKTGITNLEIAGRFPGMTRAAVSGILYRCGETGFRQAGRTTTEAKRQAALNALTARPKTA